MTSIAQDTRSTLKNKFAAAVRSILIHFVKAHELQAVALMAAEQDRAAGSRQLNSMANKFESSQPNLAAELRFIASRG